MKTTIGVLFDFLKQKHKDKEEDKVDLTHLKAYFSNENVHNHNPTLFKRVNDMADSSNFTKGLNR